MPRFASVNEDLILEVGGANDIVLERNGVEVDRRGAGGFGKVLQVIQNHFDTTSSQAITAGVISNITDLSLSITPKYTSSRIMVEVRWFGEFSATANDNMFGLKRDTSAIGSSTSVGSRNYGINTPSIGYAGDNGSTPETVYYQYIDTPNTVSTITYHATIRTYATQTMITNRSIADGDNLVYERGTSSITLWEIAQ
jgi:hypothetical protein